jgi:carboxyl-terminal processing protease
VESYVFYRTKDASYTFTGAKAMELTKRGEPLSCLDEDTAYIRLIQFTGRAASLMKKALTLFKQEGKKNLVLDLRGNGGGNLDIMQEIAGYFCKNAKGNAPLVAVADYGEKRERFDATGNVYKKYFAEDSRICVLADVGTASASEALMGAMLDYGTITYGDICLTETRGIARTYGKGIMQTTYIMDVFKQDALKLTTATIRWPISNTCIHNRGILREDGTKSVVKSYEYETELTGAIKALFP